MTNSIVKTYDDDHDDDHHHDENNDDSIFDDDDNDNVNDEISKGVQWARISEA